MGNSFEHDVIVQREIREIFASRKSTDVWILHVTLALPVTVALLPLQIHVDHALKVSMEMAIVAMVNLFEHLNTF